MTFTTARPSPITDYAPSTGGKQVKCRVNTCIIESVRSSQVAEERADKMTQAAENPEEQFAATVVDALKHYNDPRWLGQQSPLATPYFLGALLPQTRQPESELGRGQALRRAIEQAAAAMWPGELPQSQKSLLRLVEEERAVELYGPRYLFLLLDLRYLRRYFLPHSAPNTSGAMHDLLNVSATRFFVHLQKAREKFAEALLRVTRPSLRLECPLPPKLCGRDQLLAACAHALRDGRSLSICGQAGIGKTSAGACLAAQWPPGSAFWYTFRPGLNDNLAAVVFNLAHFLQEQGCPSLWLQLMAGKALLDNLEQLAGFLREDLACAARRPVLLCFDEVDLLQTASAHPRHGVHKQVLELLESLRETAPLLLIGQRALVDTDAHYELQPLTVQDTADMLHAAGLQGLDVDRIQRAAGGNPRFLEIAIALLKDGAAEEEEALYLGGAPALKPLFNRLWRRLDGHEKRLLTALSVYRTMAPVDVWQGEPGLDSLRDRDLLKFDARGGVTLLPLFRELIYAELSPQLREELHQEGASLLAQRGHYTEAAYHLWQAGRREQAIDLWYEKQRIELEQGQAGAAYALFTEDVGGGLPEGAARRLAVIRDRLRLMHGDAAGVLENMDSYSWHLDEKITAEAMAQWGKAHHIRGDLDGALEDYEGAISVLGELSTQIAELRRERGQIFAEQTHIALAKSEVRLARFEIIWLEAVIESVQGNFLRAQELLREARRLAEAAGDAQRVAKSNQFLAMAAGNHGQYAAAREYAAAAMAYYERTGDRLSLENMRAEVAGFFLNERRFAEAIAPLLAVLTFFERIKHDLRIAYTSSNLAEAYFETGRLDLAETYALRAIQSEIQRVQPYACCTLGKVRYAQQRTADAEHVLQTGIAAAEQAQDLFIAAYLYRAYGQLLCGEERRPQALANLASALALFEQLAMPGEVAETAQLIEAAVSAG